MMSKPDATDSGISCVIPVYNEAGAMAATLRGVAEALTRSGLPWEIILVDDGSTDGTVSAAGASGVKFQPIFHPRNRGYGAAIKTGVRRAAHPWILIIDADGTYPPEEITRLTDVLKKDENAEMIVGQRTQSLATDGFFRLQAKAILTALANFLSGTEIPDLNSGLRLMRRSLVERYRPLLPDGFSLTTSITLALLCSDRDVRYVPITYRPREGESKIRPARDMYNFVKLILRTTIYFNPLKVFVPFAVILVAAGVATGIISKVLTHKVMDVTSLALFIAGLQMLLIGVVSDLVMKLLGTRNEDDRRGD